MAPKRHSSPPRPVALVGPASLSGLSDGQISPARRLSKEEVNAIAHEHDAGWLAFDYSTLSHMPTASVRAFFASGGKRLDPFPDDVANGDARPEESPQATTEEYFDAEEEARFCSEPRPPVEAGSEPPPSPPAADEKEEDLDDEWQSDAETQAGSEPPPSPQPSPPAAEDLDDERQSDAETAAAADEPPLSELVAEDERRRASRLAAMGEEDVCLAVVRAQRAEEAAEGRAAAAKLLHERAEAALEVTRRELAAERARADKLESARAALAIQHEAALERLRSQTLEDEAPLLEELGRLREAVGRTSSERERELEAAAALLRAETRAAAERLAKVEAEREADRARQMALHDKRDAATLLIIDGAQAKAAAAEEKASVVAGHYYSLRLAREVELELLTSFASEMEAAYEATLEAREERLFCNLRTVGGAVRGLTRGSPSRPAREPHSPSARPQQEEQLELLTYPLYGEGRELGVPPPPPPPDVTEVTPKAITPRSTAAGAPAPPYPHTPQQQEEERARRQAERQSKEAEYRAAVRPGAPQIPPAVMSIHSLRIRASPSSPSPPHSHAHTLPTARPSTAERAPCQARACRCAPSSRWRQSCNGSLPSRRTRRPRPRPWAAAAAAARPWRGRPSCFPSPPPHLRRHRSHAAPTQRVYQREPKGAARWLRPEPPPASSIPRARSSSRPSGRRRKLTWRGTDSPSRCACAECGATHRWPLTSFGDLSPPRPTQARSGQMEDAFGAVEKELFASRASLKEEVS